MRGLRKRLLRELLDIGNDSETVKVHVELCYGNDGSIYSYVGLGGLYKPHPHPHTPENVFKLLSL